ncbi:MAG: prolyl oligopeptidase family serine peptidase [Chroococcidiopsidaceae cyanobacterium CP_BM_RX_35]|nr:prolyl oligopeptidase family serine peptidase [Chroococcidiopsidaceae cyanobacterium CP_BM_RX_35]
MSNTRSLELAGVPIVLHPPTNSSLPAPLIILWHGFGIPNSEEMLSQTLPLEEVQAWKAYLGLPLFGKRLPAGGMEEIMQRQFGDYVLQLLLPVCEQAMQELPNVVQALRSQLGIPEQTGIGLFGFSAGGFATLLSLLESSLPITTVVLAGVTKDLVSAVDTFERGMKQHYLTMKEQFPWMEDLHTQYHWTQASEAAKQRLDFVARAFELQERKPMPAILFVHGSQDKTYPVSNIQQLYAALAPHYEQANQTERLSMRIFEHLGHQLDLETAKNSPNLQQDMNQLQKVVATWFSQHLT